MRLGALMMDSLRPVFADLGLQLETFTVESISLPEELQKMLDQRISMNMLGDMGRYTQFQMAQSMPIAAANEGAGGMGMSLGAGLAMGQQMVNAMRPVAPVAPVEAPAAPAAPASGSGSKFCINCGKGMPRVAKFCSECGSSQS
jgi:membrane protease subunit (stomatin/prohibitin family)